MNPVYFSSEKRRKGGFIFQCNNLIRVAQNNGINNLGDNQYGQEMSLNNIKDISQSRLKKNLLKSSLLLKKIF
mgnify:CR=1 FL=1